MAVLAIIKARITKRQYETLRKEIRWETDHPKGVMLHAAAFDDEGHLRVADLWATETALNTFFEKRLMPELKKMKIAAPEVNVFPVHNVNAFDAIERHRLHARAMA